MVFAPLHDNSELHGNNNLYYYETFKDLVRHRKVSNLMYHGMTEDSSHHGINGNSSCHEWNNGCLHYGIADEYEQTGILVILVFFRKLIYSVVGMERGLFKP